MTDLILTETRRRLLGECIPRIRKCLTQLSNEDIWYRPNENSNSVGNLILHLNGNVRQWLIATMGNQPDRRERQKEFDERGPLPRLYLEEILNNLEADASEVIGQLDSASLTRTYNVQGFEETGVGILIHVVEHFSYHVGQITWFTKAQKDLDMGYYAGKDLDVTR